MKNTLNAPVVVITGASSGIGRATALRFAAEGASLVLASRRQLELERLAEQCRELGGRAVALAADVTSEAAVSSLADTAVRQFGRIDVWVNNASSSVYAPFVSMPLDDFRKVMDINVMGYVYGARAALAVMLRQGEGLIVNVSSILGVIPQPYSAPYGMSKAAVRALGVTLRSELTLAGERKIKVATVFPPTIDTPFFRHTANYSGRRVTAMPPVYPPELVAKTIVKLARKPKAEVVVGSAGRSLVRQHRFTSTAAEKEVAVLTDVANLSRTEKADNTAGSLYEPLPGDVAEVSGGWGGTSRRTLRTALTWAIVLGGSAFAAQRLLRAA